MKSYRKFSRTNNNSRPHSVTDMKNSKNNKYSSTDFIFDTLNGLLLGDSGARILKDL